MNNKSTYYFVFQKNHELYGYWVEIIGAYTEREAEEAFGKRYERFSTAKNKSILKYHPKGCYEKIYLPIPDDILIYKDDPFFSPPKPREPLHFIIGHTHVGKSSMSLHMMQQWIKKTGKSVIFYPEGNQWKNYPIIIPNKIKSK